MVKKFKLYPYQKDLIREMRSCKIILEDDSGCSDLRIATSFVDSIINKSLSYKVVIDPKLKKGANDVRIKLTPSCFIHEVTMLIAVPEDRDEEEYIDQYLDSLLNEDLRYNAEWEFA